MLRIPKAAFGVVYEVARHLLRRPVVGIAAAARTRDGRWLLIRRGDTGTWAFPGGTLEWGEMLADTLPRELEEEAGVVRARLGKVLGVFSRPDRDVRFHAVTILVACEVDEPTKPPKNEIEIRDVRLFRLEDIPRPLAMGMDDLLDIAIKNGDTVLE
jgi:8-oxo-dGTP diphosphatase